MHEKKPDEVLTAFELWTVDVVGASSPDVARCSAVPPSVQEVPRECVQQQRKLGSVPHRERVSLTPTQKPKNQTIRNPQNEPSDSRRNSRRDFGCTDVPAYHILNTRRLCIGRSQSPPARLAFVLLPECHRHFFHKTNRQRLLVSSANSCLSVLFWTTNVACTAGFWNQNFFVRER